MKRSNIIDEKLLNSIISTAYGDANIVERLKVYFYYIKDPRIKELFNEYKQTAGAVHSYKKLDCPDKILQLTYAKIYGEEIRRRNKARFIRFASARPVIVTTASLIIIALVGLFMLNRQHEENQYSKADVLKAETQVKQSLAIVGRVFRKTENKLTEDVLEKHVTPPIKKSYDTINNLLNGG